MFSPKKREDKQPKKDYYMVPDNVKYKGDREPTRAEKMKAEKYHNYMKVKK